MDCMIDLETLSTHPEAFILSIGAVAFDPETGQLGGEHFYKRIHLGGDQCGAHIDAGTVQWWMNQSQEARDELFNYGQERVALSTALSDLGDFLHLWGPETLWQRGNSDSMWLERAYKRLGWIEPPFHFAQWADQRTATRGHAKPASKHVAHNALHDCLAQIEHLMSATTKNNPE